MITPLIGSIVRHTMTAVGTYVGLSGSETESLVGIVTAIIGLGWSMYNARKGK